jgi:hypothetical protein
MSPDTSDTARLLVQLVGSTISSVERCGGHLAPPLRHGTAPLIVRAGPLALYVTVDGGRGDLLAFELAAVSPGALRGAEPHALGADPDDAEIMTEMATPIERIDRLARAAGARSWLHQFCGVRLGLAGGGSLYLGTHLRALVDTEDVCLLRRSEIRDDLIATPLPAR